MEQDRHSHAAARTHKRTHKRHKKEKRDGWRARDLLTDGRDHLFQAHPLKWQVTSQQLPQNQAERINVQLVGHTFLPQYLRWKVHWRPGHYIRLGDFAGITYMSESKVDKFYYPLRRHEHVGGLEVSVHNVP
jgi:hypothetical protein